MASMTAGNLQCKPGWRTCPLPLLLHALAALRNAPLPALCGGRSVWRTLVLRRRGGADGGNAGAVEAGRQPWPAHRAFSSLVSHSKDTPEAILGGETGRHGQYARYSCATAAPPIAVVSGDAGGESGRHG